MKKGKEYEILIEQLYKKIDSESIIKRNDLIYGHISQTKREIDLSIKRQIGGHEILMIVQARDYKRKVDVNVIGEFNSVIQDVKANKGILISAKGFTKKALTLAQGFNIDTLTGVDLNNPKWSIDLEIPVILYVYNGSYKPQFKFVASQEYADYVNGGGNTKAPPLGQWKVSGNAGKTYQTITDIFNSLCLRGIIDSVCDGKEHKVGNPEKFMLLVTDGVTTPLEDFTFTFMVKLGIFFKYFKIKEFQGLINQQNFKISRANVKLENDEFTLHNFDVRQNKGIDLATWEPFSKDIKLMHSYKIEVASLSLGMPSQKVTWEFAGLDPTV